MPNWDYVLKEIKKETNDPSGESAADKVRKKYLIQLQAHVRRNIICYYSGWLSKPQIEGIEINDEDKNGFMLCIHKIDRSAGLDIFLHTPGGSGAATASLVDYLRQMFGTNIRAFVPQIAMSAGTIIACACKEIFMGKHSNLGPVDPQINGIPAYAVIAELQRAYCLGSDFVTVHAKLCAAVPLGRTKRQRFCWRIPGRQYVFSLTRAGKIQAHSPDCRQVD